jgi:hypothetical protein
MLRLLRSTLVPVAPLIVEYSSSSCLVRMHDWNFVMMQCLVGMLSTCCMLLDSRRFFVALVALQQRFQIA